MMKDKTRQGIIDFLQNEVSNCKVMVIGDVMLDRYFYGSVTRISPEAPVPVNLIEEKQDRLGGAANVAHNLARLGCQVRLLGVIGDDHHGRLLERKMKQVGIANDGVLRSRHRTTTKVRILGDHQQMIRLDFEETEPITAEVEHQLLDLVQQGMQDGVKSVIISDYGKGVCTTSLCQTVIRYAKQYNVHVLVDPKGTKWQKYAGTEYITPNVKEASAVIGRTVPNKDDALRQAAIEIQKNYNIENIMITRSEKGMSLYQKNHEFTIPTVAQEVFDVSGAGDTVISVLAAGLCSDMTVEEAAQMANFAAGIEVGKLGTYAVSGDDILRKLQN